MNRIESNQSRMNRVEESIENMDERRNNEAWRRADAHLTEKSHNPRQKNKILQNY